MAEWVGNKIKLVKIGDKISFNTSKKEKVMVIEFKETISLSEDEQGAISKVYFLMKSLVSKSRDEYIRDIAQSVVDGLDEIREKITTSFPY